MYKAMKSKMFRLYRRRHYYITTLLSDRIAMTTILQVWQQVLRWGRDLQGTLAEGRALRLDAESVFALNNGGRYLELIRAVTLGSRNSLPILAIHSRSKSKPNVEGSSSERVIGDKRRALLRGQTVNRIGVVRLEARARHRVSEKLVRLATLSLRELSGSHAFSLVLSQLVGDHLAPASRSDEPQAQ